VAHGVSLLFRGQPTIVPCARVASLAAYCGLILQLGHSVPDPAYSGSFLSPLQFRMGYAVGSALFLTASLLILLSGLLRVGNVFKMIPTPVTAGIGNGTALLLVWLAFIQISHHTWIGIVPALFMLASYLYWPLLQRRFAAFKPFPSAFFAALIGISLSTLIESPWQAAPVHGLAIDTQWVPPSLWSEYSGKEFGRLFVSGLPGCLTLALVMILETFTTASIMETRFGVRSDPNRELLVIGASNTASALLGGAPSTGSPIRSLSNWNAGGRTRISSAAALLVTTALILLLSSWLSNLPAGIIAGLFLMQATLLVDRPFLRQLVTWVGSLKRREKSPADMGFNITAIISLIAFFGNLVWASFLGIALSSLLVLRRLSGNLTAQWVYLDQYNSRRVRSSAERANLDRMHKRVGVLRLTGHLFFGNSVRIVQLVDELHRDAIAVVIDVSQVTDIDPSGLAATQWIIRALLERKLRVVVSGLKRTKAGELLVGIGLDTNVRYQVDLDRGLEFCEDFALMHSTILTSHLATMPLEKNRLLEGLNAHEITSVLMLGEMHEFEKERVIFKRDAIASGIWLLEEGKVSILSHDEGTATRLATFGPGQFVGEMGFIDGKLRSATAIADTPVRAMLLDNDAIAALMQQEPAAVLAITRNIARELSLRVRSSSALIADETSDESTVWGNSALSVLSKF
jgi:MFS superfamily sulfate permease-like transporter